MRILSGIVASSLLVIGFLGFHGFLDEFGANAFSSSSRADRIDALTAGALPRARSLRSETDMLMACADLLDTAQFRLLQPDRADQVAKGCAALAADLGRRVPVSGLAPTVEALALARRGSPDAARVLALVQRSRDLARNVPWPAVTRVRLAALFRPVSQARQADIDDVTFVLSSNWGRGTLALHYADEPQLGAYVALAGKTADPADLRAFVRALKDSMNGEPGK